MPVFARALLLTAAMALPVNAWSAQLVDYIVAVVNEDVVLNSELEQAVASIKRQIQSSGNAAPPDGELRDQVLERVIVRTLQTQRAAQRGIRISDAELNATLEDIAQQNGMTLRQFARALRTEGIDFLAIRDQVRDELIANRLRQQEVDARVTVTDRDIDTFLAKQRKDEEGTEYLVQHILVAVPEGSTDEAATSARAEAEQIRQAVIDGAEFSQLAISRSDATTALDGGDLGWRSAGALPTMFADVVDDMGVGDVSEVLETGSGYNLIRLANRRGGQAPQMVTETRARHILLQPNAIRDDAATRQKANELMAQLQDGAEFEALAREFSDDTASANQGGDLGWQPPGTMVPEFEQTMGSLEPNEISEPFRTQFGWHIVQVLDRRDRDSAREIARNRARAAIRQRKIAEDYDDWLNRLRAEAYIEMRAPPDISAIEAELNGDEAPAS